MSHSFAMKFTQNPNLVAVALDPFPVGGGITSFELVMNGIDVVSLPEKQTVLRTTQALLYLVQEERNIAKNEMDFVDLAVRRGREWREKGNARKARKDREARGARNRDIIFDEVKNMQALEEFKRWLQRIAIVS